MGSKSSSSNHTTNNSSDRRVAASDRAVGVSAGGNVVVHQVADEAFELGRDALALTEETTEAAFRFGEGTFDTAAELGERAIKTVSDTLGRSLKDTQEALFRTQDAARTESAQLAEQVIKIGIPAAAVAYIVGKMVK